MPRLLSRQRGDARGLVWLWLVLVIATAVSVTLGSGHSGAASVIVLAVTFFKVRLVGLHFMELSGAPVPLRVAFEAYVGLTVTTLVVLFLAV